MEFFRKQGTPQHTGLVELIKNLPSTDTMVEIGSAYGESANLFAQGDIKKIICIDPWQNDREKDFDELCGNNPKIEKRKNRAELEVENFADGSLDGVYVDGNHKYEACKRDIEIWLPKIKAGGWIAGHDYCDRFAGVMLAVAETLTGYESHGGIIHPERFEDTSWLVKNVNN